MIQLWSSPPTTESNRGTLCSDSQSCARATPELYSQPEGKLLARIDPGTHLLGKWTQPIGWHGPCQPPVFREGLGQRDVLAEAALRLSYLSLQDPSLLQYGLRPTVNRAPTLWGLTCFSRNRVKVEKEVEIGRRNGQGAKGAGDSFRESPPRGGTLVASYDTQCLR